MKIVLAGSSGRMGVEIRKLVESGKGDTIVAGIGRHHLPDIKKADVVIDFSQPEFLETVIRFAIEKKIPLVSGTTGLDSKKMNSLKRAAKKIPVLWAPNMSLGVQVVRHMLVTFNNLKNYHFQIDDIHHLHKKDAPSGTALYLEKNLSRHIGRKTNINSIREGEIFGVHRIIARGPEEKIVIEHEAFNRTVFARGALLCAKWIIKKKKKGFYSMEDVLNG